MDTSLIKQLNSWSFKNSFSQISNYYFNTNFPFKVLTIDTTNRCNLSCEHCYYSRNRNEGEISLSEWESKLRDLRTSGYDFVMWTGGEPLLRKDLIEFGSKLFSKNIIITNGTFPIDHFENVTYFISLDGPPQLHDRIRGRISRLIEKNIEDYQEDVVVASTIMKNNFRHLEETYNYWINIPNVRSIIFDFYTPVVGEKYDIQLNEEEYTFALNTLVSMKEKYNERVFLSENAYQKMYKRDGHTTKKCIAKNVLSLDSTGSKKSKCFLGEDADCTRCGKFIPYAFYSVFHDLDLHMLRNICDVI